MKREEKAMDMRKYASGFIKPDDVRDGPRTDKIINVFISEKYNCPVLELESGDQFLVNNTNTKILNKAWGWDSDDWINQIVEFSLGHYKDWRADPPEEKETVAVRAVSPRQPAADDGGTKAVAAPRPRASDMNDDIPF